MMEKQPILALTMGDPAGIGPEIIVKAWAQAPEVMRHCCVAGDLAVMQRAAAICLERLTLPQHSVVPEPVLVADWCNGYGMAQPHHMPVLQACQKTMALPVFGQVQALAGQMAAQCITAAAQAALQGACSAVVTAPIHKEALAAAGYAYPGHTEMLQALAAQHQGVAVEAMPVRMMLANAEIKTVLNSIHVSLREAIDAVTTANVVQTIQITHQFLRQLQAGTSAESAPVIAIAGLNPHAGEGGRFGREEIDIITPVIEMARQQGMDARGPFPPDTVFMTARAQAQSQPPFCDAVVAMYHDQGLIPVKYLGVQHGVNVTLGLPLLRTSPDHGTAFDIAGTAHADSNSLLEAVKTALQLLRGE